MISGKLEGIVISWTLGLSFVALSGVFLAKLGVLLYQVANAKFGAFLEDHEKIAYVWDLIKLLGGI